MTPLKPEFRRFLLDSGFPPFARLADDLETTAPATAIRLNPRKPGAAVPPGARPVPWHPRAYLLPERPDFTLDPAMHQGAYYVQDPSSMFVAEILRQLLPQLPANPRVLDLCAAPGGKSTAMIDLLPDGSLMVSNEYDFRRAEILKENIIKWGYPCCVVSRGDTARYRSLPEFFDLVVVDAPCSGEGMMRKDPKAREQWSPGLVAQCATLQEEILDNAAATLRPGGFLIYSTCTFNTEENERQTSRLIASGDFTPVEIATDPAWNILAEAPEPSDYPSLRFLPGRVEGEGYTVAVLRKTGDSPERSALYTAPAKVASPKKARKGAKETKGAKEPKGQQQKLPEAELLARVPASLRPRLASFREGEIAAIPEAIYPLFQELTRALDIIHTGVTVAETKGRDYPPTQSLALLASPSLPPSSPASLSPAFPSPASSSPYFASSASDSPVARPVSPKCWVERAEGERLAPLSPAFPTFEVDTATALDYLRRQAITLPPVAPKGYLLLTHTPSSEATAPQSAPGEATAPKASSEKTAPLPLGFVKNLGNRANNLYPAPWRILKS